MSIFRSKKLWAVIAACGCGTMFNVAGCTNYWITAGVTGFDVCSVINCTGSTFFDFCQGEGLFIDCPNTGTTEP